MFVFVKGGTCHTAKELCLQQDCWLGYEMVMVVFCVDVGV